MALNATVLEEVYDDNGVVDMKAVAKVIGEPLRRLAALTPVTPQALQKQPKAPKAQPAARRFVRLLERIIENTGSKKYAMIWLRHPHDQLSGRSPLDVIEAGQIEVIEGMIRMYETGQPV